MDMDHGAMSHAVGGHQHGTAGMIAKGTALSVGIKAGRHLVSTISKKPWLMIGIGFAAGYMVHKHRKGIIESANSVAGKGKDFVLNQKENLEDLVAERQEKSDDAAE